VYFVCFLVNRLTAKHTKYTNEIQVKSMIDLNHPEIRFLVETVRRAALLVRRVQAELVTPALTKSDRSPVTVADFASQALVAALLAQAFPQDALVAEESADALRQTDGAATLAAVSRFVAAEIPAANPEAVCHWIDRGAGAVGTRYWTLDPIDGTKGFLRRDQYAVALALVVNGQVQIGALGCPNLTGGLTPDPDGPGSLVIAARRGGAWSASLESPGEYTRLSVSDCAEPAQARLLRSFESGHTNVGQIDALAQAFGATAEPVRMDSQAKYAVLAAGGGELLLRLLSPDQPGYREKIWDHAAGSIILEEAGGQVTDLDGRPLDFTRGRALTGNRGLLASNRRLHPAALQAVRLIDA
jgi:3'(2'), 5'-bisphosphate nucleotidase